MMFRRGLLVALAVTSLLASSACTSAVGDPKASAPAPTQTPAVSLGALAAKCADIAPADLVTAVLGAVELEDEYAYGASTYALRRAVVQQDGGMKCQWTKTSDAGETTLAMSVTAVPDAADVFERFQKWSLDRLRDYWSFTSYELFDGALIQCSNLGDPKVQENACDWHVLVGDVWFFFSLWGIPIDDVVDLSLADRTIPVEPVLEGSASLSLISAMIDATLSVERVALVREPASLPSCSDLVAAVSSVSDVTTFLPPGSDASGAISVPDYPEISDFSAERLGFRDCNVNVTDPDGGYLFRFLITKGLDWLLEAPYPPPSFAYQEVEGVGSIYDECTSEYLAYEMCDVLVTNEDVLIAFNTDTLTATPVARALIAALGM